MTNEHSLLLRSFGIDCETVLDTKVRSLQPIIGPLLRPLMIRGDFNISALLEDTDGFIEQLQVIYCFSWCNFFCIIFNLFIFTEIVFDGL